MIWFLAGITIYLYIGLLIAVVCGRGYERLTFTWLWEIIENLKEK